MAAIALAIAFALAPAHAEKADRLKEMNIVSDRGGKLDQQNRFAEVEGNVVITKGTILMHADRVQVRQSAAGYDTAVAFGASGRPATFRQKRDGADEYVEGEADRLEYDARTDTVKFVNNAVVRRLRGATVTDEISGNLITYDGTSQVSSVSGGATPTPANPTGRVRVTLTPREGTEAAAEAARGASSNAPALKVSPELAAPGAASGVNR
ncbi:MAG TPA: lipopolysaccharide transport periplasmic protein LptA [Burkholderiaceae bacterium]|nr:lipopolysaccharide transport periplasmic protein LptA [Burkholderiaceae bacterium]